MTLVDGCICLLFSWYLFSVNSDWMTKLLNEGYCNSREWEFKEQFQRVIKNQDKSIRNENN